MLLQKAVIIDPYARSIVGRRQYGQLAQVRYIFHDSVGVLLPGRAKQLKSNTDWQACTTLPYAIRMADYIFTAN